jgi:hypothetical protein
VLLCTQIPQLDHPERRKHLGSLGIALIAMGRDD